MNPNKEGNRVSVCLKKESTIITMMCGVWSYAFVFAATYYPFRKNSS